jgi:hypothetical protein
MERAMSKDIKIIGGFECPLLNEAYMEGLANRYVNNQGNLLDHGKVLKKLEFLQTMKSPGLRAEILEKDKRIEVMCPHYVNQKICNANLKGDGYCLVRKIIQNE